MIRPSENFASAWPFLDHASPFRGGNSVYRAPLKGSKKVEDDRFPSGDSNRTIPKDLADAASLLAVLELYNDTPKATVTPLQAEYAVDLLQNHLFHGLGGSLITAQEAANMSLDMTKSAGFPWMVDLKQVYSRHDSTPFLLTEAWQLEYEYWQLQGAPCMWYAFFKDELRGLDAASGEPKSAHAICGSEAYTTIYQRERFGALIKEFLSMHSISPSAYGISVSHGGWHELANTLFPRGVEEDRLMVALDVKRMNQSIPWSLWSALFEWFIESTPGLDPVEGRKVAFDSWLGITVCPDGKLRVYPGLKSGSIFTTMINTLVNICYVLIIHQADGRDPIAMMREGELAFKAYGDDSLISHPPETPWNAEWYKAQGAKLGFTFTGSSRVCRWGESWEYINFLSHAFIWVTDAQAYVSAPVDISDVYASLHWPERDMSLGQRLDRLVQQLARLPALPDEYEKLRALGLSLCTPENRGSGGEAHVAYAALKQSRAYYLRQLLPARQSFSGVRLNSCPFKEEIMTKSKKKNKKSNHSHAPGRVDKAIPSVMASRRRAGHHRVRYTEDGNTLEVESTFTAMRITSNARGANPNIIPEPVRESYLWHPTNPETGVTGERAATFANFVVKHVSARFCPLVGTDTDGLIGLRVSTSTKSAPVSDITSWVGPGTGNDAVYRGFRTSSLDKETLPKRKFFMAKNAHDTDGLVYPLRIDVGSLGVTENSKLLGTIEVTVHYVARGMATPVSRSTTVANVPKADEGQSIPLTAGVVQQLPQAPVDHVGPLSVGQLAADTVTNAAQQLAQGGTVGSIFGVALNSVEDAGANAISEWTGGLVPPTVVKASFDAVWNLFSLEEHKEALDANAAPSPPSDGHFYIAPAHKGMTTPNVPPRPQVNPRATVMAVNWLTQVVTFQLGKTSIVEDGRPLTKLYPRHLKQLRRVGAEKSLYFEAQEDGYAVPMDLPFAGHLEVCYDGVTTQRVGGNRVDDEGKELVSSASWFQWTLENKLGTIIGSKNWSFSEGSDILQSGKGTILVDQNYSARTSVWAEHARTIYRCVSDLGTGTDWSNMTAAV